MKKIIFVTGLLIFILFFAAIYWFFVIYDAEKDLVAAAGDRDIKKLKILLSKENTVIDGRALDDWTALTLASCKGYHDVVELLLNAGADVNAVSGGGKTALFWARYYEHEDIVDLLKKNGAK